MTVRRQLHIEENKRGIIGQLYLPRGSNVVYNFTLSTSNSNSSLVYAKIHTFHNLGDYWGFLREEEFSPLKESAFLSPKYGQTNLTISSHDEDN